MRLFIQFAAAALLAVSGCAWLLNPSETGGRVSPASPGTPSVPRTGPVVPELNEPSDEPFEDNWPQIPDPNAGHHGLSPVGDRDVARRPGHAAGLPLPTVAIPHTGYVELPPAP